MPTQRTELSNEPTVLPASFAQQRLWFLDQFEGGGAVYNVPLATRLRGPLDVDALERAVNVLVERHESLRTEFTLVDGAPHQLIRPARPVSLTVVDLSDAPAAEQRGLALATQQARASFDLSVNELFRVALIKLGAEDHLLSLTLHHIITDAWSMGVLNRELSVLYGGFVEGREVKLPELPIQYGDYAVWQQRWMESGGLDEQLDYWKTQLAGAPTLLQLPTDRPRPAMQSFRGATVSQVLPVETLERIKAQGEREGATLFMTQLAAFAVLLSRYSGQEDVVIASPVANRNRVELESVIGFLVNTLALRVDLEGEPSFAELVRRVREVALGAFANQDLPFEKLVEELNPERHLSHAPVAQVLFVAQNAVESPITFPGLTRERVGTKRGTAKFDLSFFVAETPEGLRLSVEYCTDLFEEATALRMLEHYRALLEAAVSDPACPIGKLGLLSEQERTLLLGAWNQTATDYPLESVRPVHELVSETTRRTPAATAVQFGEQRLTYAQLDARSNQLAHHLIGLGVGREVLVGICVERSLEMVIGLLGILKAGGAYVPIDPAYPAERQEYMLTHSQAPVLLTQQSLRGRLALGEASVVCLDSDSSGIAAMPAESPAVPADPEQLAYVIYTSGSTGKPKGVQISHRALANFLLAMRRTPGLSAEDVLVAVTTLSFDIAGLELYLPLIAGARVVIAPAETSSDPRALAGLLEQSEATVMQATPTTWRMLVDSGWTRGAQLKGLCGGEALPAALAEELVDRDVELWNMYGPTETTIWSTCSRVRRAEPITIGRPIANTSLYILDAARNPVPVGVAGELWIGGDGVARGYLDRPDVTEERFVPDPFASSSGSRMYRTGDLARYRADGNVEYLNRIDHQVKVRGFRIELGEIETVLSSHDAVASAVVVACGSGGEAELAAYVIPRGVPVAAAALRQFLAQKLPAYMVPSTITILEAFPLTANGKVDRKALPEPTRERSDQHELVAPRTETEQRIADIWSNVLSVREIGIHDNFFALGGHSLRAMQVISRVRDVLGVTLPLRAIFEAPSVLELACEVERAEAAPAVSEPHSWSRIVPTQRTELSNEPTVLPASFAQQRLWFLDQFEGGGAVYNVPLATRLRGPLDVDALERAVNVLVERHESLRTEFTLVDGAPHQLIRPARPVSLTVVDLSDAPAAEQRGLALATQQARASFDLSVNELFRVALIKLGAEDHLLSLTLHHIITDAWSMGVLNRELSVLYGGFVEGREVKLPELPIQYGDYAVWQQRWMESGGLDEQLDYWKTQLAGAPTLLQLPTDRPRPAMQSFRGATVSQVLPVETLERIKAQGEREGATLFMTQLAAFAVLLSRYSGQEDVVIASPVANRNRVELESVIGFLVNTLALRVDLEGEPSFAELVRRVREVALGAFANQDLPFEKLVEELNPERHLSHAPVAQVLFVAQNAVESPITFPGLTRERVGTKRGTAKFDLSFFVAETPEGLRLSVEYCTDLFEEATALRMLEHYRALLEAAVSDPACPIGKLGLLSEQERTLLLGAWNQTATDYPLESVRPVHELVSETTRRTPAATAVQFGEQRLTYAQLDARSNQLAHHLIGLGVGREVLVGICVERSLEMVIGLLGILKAGGAYVPIDPAYPAERQEYMLTHSQAPVLLTQQSLRGRLALGEASVVCLDSDSSGIAAMPAESPAVPADPEQLAYVIYTSGSTGKPKGVQISHRALANFLLAMRRTPGLSAEDVLVAVTTLSFDIAGLELYLPLIAGARVVIAPAETSSDPRALAGLLEQSEATVMQATPTTWRMLVDSGWTRGAQLKGLCGGEALPAALAEELVDRDVELWNMYGPTETTIWSTCSRVRRAEPITIGRPIANTSLYILDAARNPVPVGVAGELWIGGDGVARGYLDRPDVTEERFVPDPFASSSGSRMYRTGDLARYRADGNVEYLNRIDHQVKVRGFRIELGEIETVLSSHDAVASAVVVACGSGGEAELAAYVIPRGVPVAAAALRQFLAQKLPAYMVPSTITILEAFPLTANGKVDRKALPEPTRERSDQHELVAPRTETEQRIADIWSNVLSVREIGIHDNFFALGGHSLRAMQVISRVRDVLGVTLPLRAIFEAPSVLELACEVERAEAAPAVSEPHSWSRIVPTQRTELSNEPTVLPASFAQQRLWFLDQFEGGGAVYNVPLATRLRGPLDVDALERAVNVLVERHESLRTEFTLVDGAPHQLIRPARPVSLTVVDLSDAPAAEQRGLALATQQARASFDLSVNELFRVALIKLGAEDHLLSLTLHHIITDAWSMGVLNRELSVLYGGFVEGREVKLPELPIQYGDYAVWQQRWMESGGLDEQLDYWKTQLAGAPTLLQLPTDRPRPAMQSFRGATVSQVLPVETLERIKAQGEREGATLFMTQLAAFAVLLSRYSGQEDVVIASPVANRNRVELESVIGFLVNTLALRVDLEGEPSFAELVRRVREVALGAFANQDLPFEKLVEELNPERHLSHAPVAQVLFVAQNAVESPITFPGLTRERVGTKRGTAKFDLSFFVAETPEGLRLSVEYCTDLFEEATALRMLEHYRALLEAAVSDPACPIGKLGLLSEQERTLLLGAWNQTATDYPLESVRPVHELVSETTRRTPAATAVQFGEQRLTYAQLDARSNQLAHHLIGLGVGREVLVGICVERSLEMVIGLLGILKAGGAYVPIDPAYPAERVAFMLADTDTRVLLTQQHLLAGLPSHRGQTVCLNADRELIDSHDDGLVKIETALDDLAYVIYTSGSTGQPKGVAMGHRPLANLLAWQLESFSAPAVARTLQFASLSFDVAFQEVFSTWCSGGTLVLIDEAVRRDPEALLAFVSEQLVERLFLPFVALQNLCAAAGHLGASIPSLREVITAGEQLKATDAVRSFFAAHPSCALVNQYGPTESHVVSAFGLSGPAEGWPALPPIGKPIANAKLYLLDGHQQPVPIGVPGELYIGGVSLARGYLNRPELTSERFVPDPLSQDPDARLYRTGDLARYLPDGNIDYIGRSDHQMKIRGFRIEPGEIESALREHPLVREALVLAREDDAGEKRLVAYLISDAAATSPDDLRELLRRTLPDYMIPSAFVFLEAFPLTPNRKVDRAALPAPSGRGRAISDDASPQTDTERRLAEIWSKVLDIEEIGVHENFFELGGHSLMAVRLFAVIERKLGVRLPLSALFRTSTIAGLAELIDDPVLGEQPECWSSIVPMRPGQVERPLFLVGCLDGEVLLYRELVENLDSGLAVFGLTAPGVDGVTPPLASVEELAAHYVKEVRGLQPHGPYRLGGFCFSGLVAYEMAGLLREAGEDVGLLALIHTYPYRPPRPHRRFERDRMNLRAFKDADLRGKGAWVLSRLGGIPDRARAEAHDAIGPRVYELLASRNLQRLIPRRPLNLVLIASNLARRSYVPRPLDVRVEFFRAQTAPDSRPTTWEALAGRGVGLRQIVAPDINHDRMTHEPHVRLLAAELTRALDESIDDAGAMYPDQTTNGDGPAHPAASTNGSRAAHVVQAHRDGADTSAHRDAGNESDAGSRTET